MEKLVHSVADLQVFLFNNGYLKTGAEGITETTQKFKNLLEICFSVIDVRTEIISPDLLIKAINGEIEYKKPKYVKPETPQYKKIKRPEGYLTLKERKAKREADKAARKERELKYGRNVYRKPK